MTKLLIVMGVVMFVSQSASALTRQNCRQINAQVSQSRLNAIYYVSSSASGTNLYLAGKDDSGQDLHPSFEFESVPVMQNCMKFATLAMALPDQFFFSFSGHTTSWTSDCMEVGVEISSCHLNKVQQ